MKPFSLVTATALQNVQDELKRRNARQKPLTNYFLNPLDGVTDLCMLESEKSLCFMHDEWDFARFYFQTFEVPDLERLLHAANWPPLVVADWIARETSPALEQLFANLGFHLHAIYDRIVCQNLRRERQGFTISLAGPADRDTIHSLLFRAFDKYADHIMSVAELEELIGKEQVLLSRGPQGTISGLVVFPIKGQTTNFNFLYNQGGSANLVHLLENFYGVLNERGIQSGFSWVRRTRPLVLKLHESFGWKKDGLVDHIYMR